MPFVPTLPACAPWLAFPLVPCIHYNKCMTLTQAAAVLGDSGQTLFIVDRGCPEIGVGSQAGRPAAVVGRVVGHRWLGAWFMRQGARRTTHPCCTFCGLIRIGSGRRSSDGHGWRPSSAASAESRQDSCRRNGSSVLRRRGMKTLVISRHTFMG